MDIEFSHGPKLGLSDLTYYIDLFPLCFLDHNRSLLTLACRASRGEVTSIHTEGDLSQFRNSPINFTLTDMSFEGAVNSVIYKLMDIKYKGIPFRRCKIRFLNLFKNTKLYDFFDYRI